MTVYPLYFALGAVAGFLSGLLGIGGGVLLVPGLVAIFSYHGFSQHHVMHLATSTALASIIFSALIAVFYQQRRGAIHWPIFGQLMPGMLLGLLGGAFLSLYLSTETLKILFSLFLWMMALKLFLAKKEEGFTKNERPPLIIQWIMGALIGLISGLLGIGGGAMAVPILLRLGLKTHQAIATSSACILAISLLGTFLFTLASLHLSGLPEGSHSFVYWPAVLGLALGSLLCVPLGVRLGQRLSGSKLRKLFAFFLLIVSFTLFLF
jgi:uncharacterized protein